MRLARAPKMMGDFFGMPFGTFSGDIVVGRSVHQTTSTLNEFNLIEETGSVYAYLSGAGTEFVLSGGFGPSPPANGFVDGLESDVPGEFYAEGTGDFIDVYNNPTDLTPDLSGAEVYEIYEEVEIEIPGGPADLIGRARLQDNNSAMPQDRVYLDYSYFHNAALTSNGIGVNRFTPGLEKTFLGGMGSVEVRLPMGVTLSNSLVSSSAADVTDFELGNLVIAPKLLIYACEDGAIACGLGVAIPTADDLFVRLYNGVEALRVRNDSVHVLPYLAALYAPKCSSTFAHAFLTFDFDTNGNATYANLDGGGLERIGTWSDQHLVSLNLAYGAWVYQSRCRRDRLQGVALVGELHYNATLNDADTVEAGSVVVGNSYYDLSLVNATLGGHVRMGQTTFTAGYGVPLTSSDSVFDGELRLFVNRSF